MKASLPHYFIGIPIPADIAEPIWEAAKKEPALSFKNGCTRMTIILRSFFSEPRMKNGLRNYRLCSQMLRRQRSRLPYSFSIWIFSATADSRECFTLSPNGMNCSLICGKKQNRLF